MATVITEPDTDANHPGEKPDSTPPAPAPSEPQGTAGDEALLVNRMPEWFRAPRALAGFICVLGLFLCVLSRWPVYHTDVWSHLAYGRLIAQSKSIPAAEPFMPLSKGMPVVDSAWLSQVVGYGVHAAAGIAGLQFLFAAVVTACFGIFCRQCYRRGRSVGVCLFGCGLFLWAHWSAIKILRPQLGGLLCFLLLFSLLTSRRWRRVNWIAVPALFALWANLHGSFIVGLGLIGAFGLGRAIDVFRRTKQLAGRRRLSAVFQDVPVRRTALLLELAAAAALLNPYGIGLYAHVFQFSSNPNLAALIEWSPLTLRMDGGGLSQQGTAAAAIAVLLMFLYRFSPRRVSAVEPILLLGLGAAMLWTSRMIVWWSPVAAYYVVLHAGAVLRQWRQTPHSRAASPSTSLWAVVSIGMVWIAFAYTPLGMQLIHGTEPKPENSLTRQTPYQAAEYLQKQRPTGLIFNTLEMGDYLVWDSAGELKPFITSHVHLVPREVMDDYLSVIYLDGQWEALLDRYGVNTVVLDPSHNDRLTQALRKKPDWRLAFDNSRTVVFRRKKPI